MDCDGLDYVSVIAISNQLSPRKRKAIAAAAIELWERFARP